MECPGLKSHIYLHRDALDRHSNVHRPRVSLRRFRACTRCAASRVKCSGAPPCTRCQKKSLACTFPVGGGGGGDGGGNSIISDASAEGVAAAFEDDQYASPRSDETHSSIMITAPPLPPPQQQQHGHQGQHPAGSVQDQRTQEAYSFIPQPIQPLDLMPNERNTHMISTLNWISPNMVFDLAEFDYNPVATTEQYWGTTAQLDLSNQVSGAIQPTRPIDSQSNATPGSFPDSENAETPGTAYVDNRGARQPRNGRYANRIFDEGAARRSLRSCAEVAVMTPEPDGFSLTLPSFPGLLSQRDPYTRVQPFSLEQYRMLCQAFQDCYSAPYGIGHDGPFVPAELPSMAVFTTLLALYRYHFDPKVLPLIHTELESDHVSFWVVKLAMSAIGSQYLDTGDVELAIALHEFLRRVLRQRGAVFSMQHLMMESLGLVQAGLLNYIGLAYCGSRRLERHRASALERLVGEYISLYRTQPSVLQDEIVSSDRQDWILAESARRLCHTIWLMDSMSRYHSDTRPNLLLDFADIALPCKEDVWQAATDQTLAPIKQPTLEKALRVLYVEKRLLRGIGNFGRVLIIHGLFCQTWDVARSLNRPLLHWTPSAQKGDAESHELTGPTWLPQIPLYNHWRNAACDCLDVLHWIANSDIAQAGTENSTVLHLHFARIVLLAPYQTIREMAELLVSEDIRHDDGGGGAMERFQEQCREVQRWITDDQFKARLSLVHCGVFFWHVRRYSTDAFYEPVKVFLATLVIWAYGSLCPPQHQHQQQQQQQSSGPPRAPVDSSRARDDRDWSSDLDDISSIRLDRPTDDELVQIFIKRGRSMRATIMGVGNITAAGGPQRMLREGCKLLGTLDGWPMARNRYLDVLTRLAGVCGPDGRWVQSSGAEVRGQARQPGTSR